MRRKIAVGIVLLAVVPLLLAASSPESIGLRGKSIRVYVDMSPRERQCRACFATWALCNDQATSTSAEGVAAACATWFEQCADGGDTCNPVAR